MTKCKPDCYGHFEGKYSENPCLDCGDKDRCYDETANKNKPKRKIDDAWINAAIDMLIGPNLAFLSMDYPTGSKSLREIMVKAVRTVCKNNENTPNPELIAAISAQLNQMYGRFITAKLDVFLREGVPEKKRIVSLEDSWLCKNLN